MGHALIRASQPALQIDGDRPMHRCLVTPRSHAILWLLAFALANASCSDDGLEQLPLAPLAVGTPDIYAEPPNYSFNAVEVGFYAGDMIFFIFVE